MAKDSVFLARRDTGTKQSVPRAEFVESIATLLDEMQAGLTQRARDLRSENSCQIDSLDEFREYFTPENCRSSGDSWRIRPTATS